MWQWCVWMQGVLQHQRQPGKRQWCVPGHLPQHRAVQLGQGRRLHQRLQPGERLTAGLTKTASHALIQHTHTKHLHTPAAAPI